MLKSVMIDSKAVIGLKLYDVNGDLEISMGTVYSRNIIPTHRNSIPRPESALKYEHLKHLSDKIMPYRADLEIELLIGLDCPNAIKPRNLISGPNGTPWAVRTNLGWGIAGIMDGVKLQSVVKGKMCHVVFDTHVKEMNPATMLNIFNQDFEESSDDVKFSVEDRKFLTKMETEITKKQDGHFELPLPVKDNTTLPRNRDLALVRCNSLKKRLLYDVNYKKDYCDFMSNVIENGYAELVPKCELSMENGKVWYIPHHGVYHAKKQKIRIVFDCSSNYKQENLN